VAEQQKASEAHCAGFDAFRRYPLYDAIFHRRTRRVSKGIKKWKADSLNWHSDAERSSRAFAWKVQWTKSVSRA
jgi:hypothetical protein